MPPKNIKRIAIIHYRVGGTDGVSLEIEKRKKILENLGHSVKLIAGPRSRGADFIIKELEWDDGVVPIIKENGFVHFKRKDLTARELKIKMNKICYAIQDRLNFIQLQEKFDAVLIHNIFSFGGHIAAAKAVAKWIKKFKIKSLATHHDFYWERKEFQLPRSGYLKNYMDKYMPPKSKHITHVVINTIAKRELKKRCNIDALVQPDLFDFSQEPWKKDAYCSDFLKTLDIKKNDLIILQATRIIPRKAIEISIDFAKQLQLKINKLRGKKIYNKKRLGLKSNVVLIMAGYAENENREYLFKLKTHAFDSGVHTKFISDHVQSQRRLVDGKKIYSLWDAYVNADLVTFPSVWEGWGNQFIEAIFARKPIVVFEYPVFKTDIKKEGYDIISLENGLPQKNGQGLYQLEKKKIKKAVRQTIKDLKDKKLTDRLESNFEIGKKYHDQKILEKFLIKNLEI